MTTPTKEGSSTIIPAMRYRNAPAAIEWLCQAFGFEKQLVCPGENGAIVHAQLTFGHGMMMLGSVRENDFSKLVKQPDQIEGFETQCPYAVVKDADAHYARAVAAGAKSIQEPADQPYGDRNSGVIDPFGNTWYIATHIKDVAH